MTVVVSDTSPLNYLVIIGEIGILPQLYSRVLIPSEVLAELEDASAPPEVLRWVRARPEWLEVRKVDVKGGDAALDQVDAGERAAILLAEQDPGALLIFDDASGRAAASRRGIWNTGTLGVLRAAAIRGLVDLPAALTRLAATNFRAPASLIADLLADDLERKSR